MRATNSSLGMNGVVVSVILKIRLRDWLEREEAEEAGTATEDTPDSCEAIGLVTGLVMENELVVCGAVITVSRVSAAQREVLGCGSG